MASTPFDNLDSAHEYLRLLALQVNDVSEDIQQEIASGSGEARHVDALRLVAFKLQQLNLHVTASRGILNDLRMLRRVLVGERNASDRSAGDAASEKDARSQRPVAR